MDHSDHDQTCGECADKAVCSQCGAPQATDEQVDAFWDGNGPSYNAVHKHYDDKSWWCDDCCLKGAS